MYFHCCIQIWSLVFHGTLLVAHHMIMTLLTAVDRCILKWFTKYPFVLTRLFIEKVVCTSRVTSRSFVHLFSNRVYLVSIRTVWLGDIIIFSMVVNNVLRRKTVTYITILNFSNPVSNVGNIHVHQFGQDGFGSGLHAKCCLAMCVCVIRF